MKSIFLRNFMATALLVFVSFVIIALAFVGIGRSYVISDYCSGMENCAREVARMSAAIARGDSLSSWVLSMSISSLSQSTGDHVFITDENGVIVSCSDRNPMCEHLGQTVAPEILERIGSFRGELMKRIPTQEGRQAAYEEILGWLLADHNQTDDEVIRQIITHYESDEIVE